MCDFIDELGPAELERRVEPPFLNPVATLKVGAILLQIIHDAVEWRRQLHVRLYRLGIPTLPETQRVL